MLRNHKWNPNMKSFLRILLLITVYTLSFIEFANLALLETKELCLAEDGNFECASKECIPYSKACDGTPNDCPDGSDEWAHCELSCSGLNCEHACVPNIEPGQNGTCFCHSGFRISGSKKNRCKNINECEIWGTCSQLCDDFDGSFKCGCQTGFILEGNNKTCVPEDPNILVVYALKKSIRVYNMKEKSHYSIMENMGQTVAVTVDVENQQVLWTDISDKREAIYRSSINGNATIETVVDFGLELVEGLAYDWITGNIYFTDSSKRHIVACTSDGSHCTILVKEYMDRPREITLHPNEGIMFWTNWGEKASIVRSQMDGLDIKPIVLTNLQWPNGLTVDHGNSRLYWSDAKYDLIETVDLNGNDRKVVRSAGDGHHFSLDVFADTLFWSDWQTNGIHSCNKFSGKNETIVVHESNSDAKMSKPNGLSIFHSAAQPKIRSNQCASAGCLHICVLAPGNAYTCACPSGMTLDSNGKNCRDDINTAKIAIGHENQLGIYRYGSIGRDLIEENQLKEKTSIGAVHYNPINETIFVSDIFWHKIYEFNPRTKKLNTIVGEHIDTVSGLSLDVVGQNLYWADTSRRKIEVLSLRTGARALISSEKDYPQDLVVVPEKKFLFVALTSSRFGRIMKYNMNGYNRTTLVRISRGEPVSLTYNRDLDRIFWCDIYKETIEHISLDGREQSTAFQTNSAFSMASFRNHIFWTDRRTQLLNAMAVLGTDVMEQPVFIGKYEDRHNTTHSSYVEGNFFAKISILQKDLTIYNSMMETHECSATKKGPKKCSHICLISNDENSGTCLCPDGMELEGDLKTCAKKCYNDQFQCNDKKCISGDWKCDGFKDCSDGEDELDCTKSSICDPLDFECLLQEKEGTDSESATDSSTSISISEPVLPRQKDNNGKGKSSSTRKTTTTEKPHSRESSRSKTPLPEQPRPTRPTNTPRIRVMVPFDEDSDDKRNNDNFNNQEGKNTADDSDDEGALENRSLEEDGPLLTRSTRIGNDGQDGSGTTTVVIITVVLLLLVVTIIIGFILHKRRISPKTFVQPYVQQLVKYVNRPARRANKRQQFSNENVYDDAFDNSANLYASGNYVNPTYEEIDNLQNTEWNRNNSDSSKGESRSADSGILTVMDTDPNNLYEDIDDHYKSYSQKQKLITEDHDLV